MKTILEDYISYNKYILISVHLVYHKWFYHFNILLIMLYKYCHYRELGQVEVSMTCKTKLYYL